MPFFWILLVGLISGWIAGLVVRGRGYGILADIVIGVIGAFVGGLIFQLLGLQANGTVAWILMSVLGAIVCLAIVKAIHKSA